MVRGPVAFRAAVQHAGVGDVGTAVVCLGRRSGGDGNKGEGENGDGFHGDVFWMLVSVFGFHASACSQRPIARGRSLIVGM